MLNRREFIGAAAQAALPRRPNLLYIVADQWRAQTTPGSKDPNLIAPNLERLTKEGIHFSRCYASNPVCTPSRAAMQTGKFSHACNMPHNDLLLPLTENTIAAELGKAGYKTGYIGKWHLDGGPREPGFVPPGSRRQGFEFWAANEVSHAHFNNHYFRDDATPIPIRKFEAEGWTDVAVEFLKATKQDARPFFLTVQMGPPHDPYKAPPEYTKLYDPAKLTMRANWKDAEGLPGRKAIAEYYGMITAVDDQVGRMMRTLDELGLADDTIVLLSSDHGDMLGSQGRRLKRKPWEESTRVPGILRYPGKVKPRSTEKLFSHIDIAPTLLSLCGQKPPAFMQGTDFSQFILHEKGRTPDSVFFQIFGPYQGDGTEDGWRGVRTDRYMYARFESKPWVLYDLQADPDEMKNLIDDKALVKKMDALLTAWMKKTGDSWSYDWHELVEDAGRLYKDKAFYTVDEYLKWKKAQ